MSKLHSIEFARLLDRNADESPNVALLAVLVRGCTLGYSAYPLRRWLRHRSGRTDLTALVANQYVWSRLYRSAHARVGLNSSAAGRAEIAVRHARPLVGHLLSEPDPRKAAATATRKAVTPCLEANARLVLAVLGGLIVEAGREHGYDAVQIGKPRLAALCGLSKPGLTTALNTCQRLGWIRALPAARKQDAKRYALGRLSGRAKDVADGHYDLIGAVAHGDTEDPVAALILAAAHPAICHATRGAGTRRAWLWALTDQAGIDPGTLGVSTRSAKPAARTWLAMMTADGTVAGSLDAYAEANDCAARAVAAETTAREEAARRHQAVVGSRERHRRVHKGVTALLDQHPIPDPSLVAEADRWARAFAAAIARAALPEDLLPEVAPVLRKRLTQSKGARAGYDAVSAQRLSAAVAERLAEVAAAA